MMEEEVMVLTQVLQILRDLHPPQVLEGIAS
jgi:hypothetical protein